MITTEPTLFVDAQPGIIGVPARGPLAFLRALINHSGINPSLKFGLMKAVDDISEYLKIRQEVGLEYLFARAMFVGCFMPVPGKQEFYDVLRKKLESFDRRQQEILLTAKEIPILSRDSNVQRCMLIVSGRKVELLRAFHIAEAHDADGPWVRTPEKAELMTLLIKTVTGYVDHGSVH